MNTRVSAQDLQKKIVSYLDDLAKETDQARKSEAMRKYLDFIARFHQYSASNIFLILLAKPFATHLAGYQAWLKMGRHVMAGERGVPIFAPMIHKEDPDDDNSPRIVNGFKVVYIFDVSQTSGEPFPPIPQWKSPEQNPDLKEKLISFAKSKGIQVCFNELPGDIQGVSKGGSIEISPTAGLKTILHGLGHELLHRSEGATLVPSLREMEAEAVAYCVARHLGIRNLNSPNYIVLNGSTSDEIRISLSIIQEAVSEIVSAFELNMHG